jgi:periplasmic protein CpxP/Spy
MAMQHDPLRLRSVQRILFAAALLLVALTVAPGAHAQGPGGMNMSPEERATQRITLLTERIQLTAQQATALKPVLVKQFTEQTALFQKYQGGGDFSAMRTEMQTLRTKNDAEIAAQLTEEQKKSYAALVEEEAARRRERMGGGGGQ